LCFAVKNIKQPLLAAYTQVIKNDENCKSSVQKMSVMPRIILILLFDNGLCKIITVV